MTPPPGGTQSGDWPALPYEKGKDTLQTLHLWAQIVGKVRLAASPWLNHSWHATLYPTARGLSTGLIPQGRRSFELEFDFVDHRLRARSAGGPDWQMSLVPRTVASFYEELLDGLAGLDLPVRIHDRPNELPDPVPFPEDEVHSAYDAEYAHRLWRALVSSHRILSWFRAGFLGKASPVHLFWGSFDLAVTRFSGRRAPLHPGGIPHLPDRVTREAYSHEVSSAGFWAGNDMVPYPAYYSYAYPTPAGFDAADIEPSGAIWNAELGEYLLPYETARAAAEPGAVLRRFLETTYEAAANLGNWDRESLECTREAPTDAEWGVTP